MTKNGEYKVKQEMSSRKQKSTKNGSVRYLMFGANHILVTLRWDQGRSPGHENACWWFLNGHTNNHWDCQNLEIVCLMENVQNGI